MSINDTVKKIKDLKLAYHKAAQDLVSPALKSMIKGKIVGYQFTAYTPYFCDGDECVYSVNDVNFKISKDPTKAEPGEEVNINALDTKGKIVSVVDDMVVVRLGNGKPITLPISEITLMANEEEFESSYSLKGEVEKQANAIEKFISDIPEDVIKDVFGDHVQITVYADKVKVESYEHD